MLFDFSEQSAVITWCRLMGCNLLNMTQHRRQLSRWTAHMRTRCHKGIMQPTPLSSWVSCLAAFKYHGRIWSVDFLTCDRSPASTTYSCQSLQAKCLSLGHGQRPEANRGTQFSFFLIPRSRPTVQNCVRCTSRWQTMRDDSWRRCSIKIGIFLSRISV